MPCGNSRAKNWSHCSDNAGSLTHCTIKELLKIYFSYHKIHPFKMYNLAVFSIFINCVHQYCHFQNISSLPKETPCPISSHSLFFFKVLVIVNNSHLVSKIHPPMSSSSVFAFISFPFCWHFTPFLSLLFSWILDSIFLSVSPHFSSVAVSAVLTLSFLYHFSPIPLPLRYAFFSLLIYLVLELQECQHCARSPGRCRGSTQRSLSSSSGCYLFSP